MGPYCKFCNTRCFVPTAENDYIKTDIKATCTKGIRHDLNSTYERALATNLGEPIIYPDSLIRNTYWVINKGQDRTKLVRLVNDTIEPFEVSSTLLDETSTFLQEKLGIKYFYRA